MTCNRCNGKGFIESPHMISNGNYTSIKQCCDITAYSNEIQRRMSGVKESDEQTAKRLLGHEEVKNNVLQFKRKNENSRA